MERIARLIVAAITLLPALPVYARCADLPGCVLVWADEFDGTTVDLTKWQFQLGDGSSYGIPGWGNNELQWYQSDNATVSGGALTIQARRQLVSNHAYTSARLRSLGRADFLYGRFEMRARLPVGRGLWPAFWMLPTNPSIYGAWAASGEIDIMESIGSNQIFGTIHYGGTYPAQASSGASVFLPSGTVDDFHEYALEWQPRELRWYVDDQLYATKTSWYSTGGPYPAPFDVDFHLLLNLAVGGTFPGNPDGTTVFPQSYVIDYVRVYQQPPPDAERAARCGSSKIKAAGKQAKCAGTVLATAVRNAATPDGARQTSCAAKLDLAFERAERRAIGSCPTDSDAGTMATAVDACLQSAADALGGVPGAGGAQALCQSRKLKQAAHYLDCRLKTASKAVASDSTPDFTRCVAKLVTSWSKLEDGDPSRCATTGELPALQADLDACETAISDDLAPGAMSEP